MTSCSRVQLELMQHQGDADHQGPAALRSCECCTPCWLTRPSSSLASTTLAACGNDMRMPTFGQHKLCSLVRAALHDSTAGLGKLTTKLYYDSCGIVNNRQATDKLMQRALAWYTYKCTFASIASLEGIGAMFRCTYMQTGTAN